MKKPLNYRLQMYRALLETMCIICWFRWIFCGFVLFFAHFRGFYAESSYLCGLKISEQGGKMQDNKAMPCLLVP